MTESGYFDSKVLIKEKHLDTFGHMNNATYLELYEDSRWDLIEAGGYGLSEIQKTKKGPVILECHLTFRKEIRLRETITIQTQFKEWKGSKVMVLAQQMINEKGEIASTLELSVGFFDLVERKLLVPNEAWKKAVGIPLD